MTSPLEQSYLRPFRHPAFHHTPEPSPAAIYAQCERESRARAAARRVDILAVDEAEAIVRRQP